MSFLKTVATAIGEMLDEAGRFQEEKREAQQTVREALEAYNAQYPNHKMYLTNVDPTETTTKCTIYRLVEDCEDKDCSIHYHEKRRLARSQSL